MEVFMNKKILISLSAFALLAGALTGCGKGDKGTADAVAKASKMSLQELEEASRKEVEAKPDGQVKIVGLTSVLKSVAKTVAAKYEWLRYTEGKEAGDNLNVNNGYKDYQLLTALDTAEDSYFADYALVQDVRSFSTMMEDGLTHNFVPSDGKSALGLGDEALTPLYGVHFNKLFWTNTNFEHITGKKLYNIWQVAGWDEYEVKNSDGTKTKVPVDHADHLSKVSFQKPDTEQINMSFLVEVYGGADKEAELKAAYEEYYGKAWAASETYPTIGQEWVTEFIANIKRWHSSDGTAMKETQLKDDWNEGFVYYGAFAKMKDAVGKAYVVDLDNDGTAGADETYTVECDGKSYTYANNTDEHARCGYKDEAKTQPIVGVNAMDTVKWDWNIKGFNGFMYCMDSQIINNAEYPYTACLFARTMLEQKTYTDAIYNSKNPDAQGNKANQYGYYYPGTADETFRYAKGDWTKEQHIAREVNEKYDFLKNVRVGTVNTILAMVSSNKNK